MCIRDRPGTDDADDQDGQVLPEEITRGPHGLRTYSDWSRGTKVGHSARLRRGRRWPAAGGGRERYRSGVRSVRWMLTVMTVCVLSFLAAWLVVTVVLGVVR